MNKYLVNFYNNVLVSLDGILKTKYSQILLQEFKDEVKKYCLETAHNEVNKEDLLSLFSTAKPSFIFHFERQGKISIPRSIRETFAEFKNGYLTYHYDPKAMYAWKEDYLNRMIIFLAQVQKEFDYYGINMSVSKLVSAIDLELKELPALLEQECEFMQIVCHDGDLNVAFNIYSSKKDLNLGERSSAIRIIDRDQTIMTELKNNYKNLKLFDNVDVLKQRVDTLKFMKNNIDAMSIMKLVDKANDNSKVYSKK